MNQSTKRKTSYQPKGRQQLLALVAIGAVASISCVTPGEESDAAINDAGINQTDSQAGEDAATNPDAYVEVVDHDFCGLELMKLPIDAEVDELDGIKLGQGKVVYAKKRVPEQQSSELYYLDLQSCKEYKLTVEESAEGPSIFAEKIYFVSNKNYSPSPNFYCRDIRRYNLATWSSDSVTSTPRCEWSPKANSTHALFQRSSTEEIDSPTALILKTLETGQELELAVSGAKAIHYDINDEYVVWTAYSQDTQSTGKDVFYLEVGSQTPIRILQSVDGYQYNVNISGHMISWIGSDVWLGAPYHLIIYDLLLGTGKIVVENDEAVAQANIDEDIAAYITSKYITSPQGPLPADVELYDLQSEAYQRLTTEQSNLVVLDLKMPYLLLANIIDPAYNTREYYLVDLKKMGVVDETGRIIQGTPVLVPPSD